MQNANPKEQIITDKMPCLSFPWEYVASDLFQWNGNVDLVVVDYPSRFSEMVIRKSTSSDAV